MSSGFCNVCSCHYSMHSNADFYYGIIEETSWITDDYALKEIEIDK